MIRVKAAYIGNGIESFVERSFTDGINVIYSIDNNKGKTVLMQGIMFALGAVPTFPSGFQYREYIYIVDLNVDGRDISVLRSKNTFAILADNELHTFESEASFSKYWSDSIRYLPSIVKKGRSTFVGLELYTQIAFIPQDGKSSAKLLSGQFSKDDFNEMLYAIKGLDGRELDTDSEEALKKRRDELKGRLKTLTKQATSLNERGTALSMVSATVDTRDMEELLADLERARKEVTDIRKKRSRLIDRLTKCQVTFDELNSLKIETKEGRLYCLECGSGRIGYRMADSGVMFDVTNSTMRSQIIGSLKERIDATRNEIDTLDQQLHKSQQKLAVLLTQNSEFSLADIIACKDDYLDSRELDLKIQQAQQELIEIKNALESKKSLSSDLRNQQREFSDGLVSKMNYAQRHISGNDQATPYDALFSTNANVYSGSDETIYFASRQYALATTMDHGMPLLVDSFRGEDLSTVREERMLELYSHLQNQMIFTTTVKKEEGREKYEMDDRLNAIDYSKHKTDKILCKSYNDEFSAKVGEFGIVLGV